MGGSLLRTQEIHVGAEFTVGGVQPELKCMKGADVSQSKLETTIFA